MKPWWRCGGCGKRRWWFKRSCRDCVERCASDMARFAKRKYEDMMAGPALEMSEVSHRTMTGALLGVILHGRGKPKGEWN
jgi:hypothetical protein